jgi:hypothetical protein
MAANPLTADERAQVERAKGADFTGFRSGTTMASLGRATITALAAECPPSGR